MIEALGIIIFWLMLGGMCAILVTAFTMIVGMEVVDRVYKILDRSLNDE